MKNRKFILFILIAASISMACTTRVSEWVLLNIIPHQYTLVYFHNGPPGRPVSDKNKVLSNGAEKANMRFESADRPEITQPYYGLFYEGRLFTRYTSVDELTGLTTSPLREKIAGELMAGKLCVMLYLKCGNPVKDGNSLQSIQKTLESSPFGKIIPLIELNRNDRAETHFISMLLNVEDDLKQYQEPMLFGIFGRFKALEPLLGKGITEENVGLMIDYFTAECSCLIKDNLPGTDILFAGTWENPQPALLNKIIDAELLPGTDAE